MINQPATAADFAKWEERAELMTEEALRYTIADCRQAELAMRGHNPIREAYYSDQAGTYHMVLRRRFSSTRPFTPAE